MPDSVPVPEDEESKVLSLEELSQTHQTILTTHNADIPEAQLRELGKKASNNGKPDELQENLDRVGKKVKTRGLNLRRLLRKKGKKDEPSAT